MASPALDARLADIARHLEHSGLAVELWDAEWRLAWVSPELKDAVGETDEDRLGYGRHWLENRLSAAWSSTVTDRTRERMFSEDIAYVLADTPGGVERLQAMVEEELRPRLDGLAPKPPPPVRAGFIDFLQGSLPPVRVATVIVQLHDSGGERLGTLFVYGAGLPPRLLALVARGNRGMFERMARLIDPGRRRAAIMFADLQGSSALSRRLPSGAYFDLIRNLTTEMDHAVIERTGIVGKHAGDGATAFFLADDLGSDAAAARSALEAGRAIAAAARRIGDELAENGGPVTAADCRVNVGVHWGGALYMGQVVTGGRLEVTALGDAVNETARIQESARDGSILASKALLERLGPEDASELDIDTERLRYDVLAELGTATDKARRDAGGVAVTALRP